LELFFIPLFSNLPINSGKVFLILRQYFDYEDERLEEKADEILNTAFSANLFLICQLLEMFKQYCSGLFPIPWFKAKIRIFIFASWFSAYYPFFLLFLFTIFSASYFLFLFTLL